MKKLYYWMVGYRSRVTYWAHSDFVKSVRKALGAEVAPNAASAREWREFNKRNTGFVNWLTDDFVDFVQDTVMFVPDVYNNIRTKFRNRFLDKMWCLDTKLDKWEYHEIQERILHGLFETLVEFVEVEKAHMEHISEDIRGLNPTWKTPSRIKGLKYLDWEINLGEESPLQAETAKEVMDLYLWWKDIRPNRPDPMDKSGWSAYCDERRDDDDFWSMLDHEDDTDEDRQRSKEILDAMHEMEEEQATEDEDMMIRLIKVRQGMWT